MTRGEVLERGTTVLSLALVAAGGAAFVAPWLGGSDPATAARDRYAPMVDGAAELYVRTDSAGGVDGWQSLVPSLRPSARAVGAEMRDDARGALAELYREEGGEAPSPDKLVARLGRARLFETAIRDLAADGSVSVNRSWSVRDARGDFLLELYDPTADRGIVFEPALPALPADLSPGARWSGAGRAAGAVVYGFEGEVSDAGPREVDGRVFDDCLQVRTRMTLGLATAPTMDERWEAWYCANAGLVEEVATDPAGRVTGRRVKVSGVGFPARGELPPASPGVTGNDPPSGPPAGWSLARVARLARTGSSGESTIPPTWIPGPPPLVIAAAHGEGLVAYVADSPSGEVAWRFRPAGAVYGPPAWDPDRGRLYFGASDKRLYALDARGLFLWSVDTGDNVATRPVVVEGTVVFGSEDRSIYGVDAATGAIRWRRSTGGPVVSWPAAADGVVVIGSDDGAVRGIDPATGRELWRRRLGEAVEAPIAVADGVAWAAARDGTVAALDPADGRLLWRTAPGSPIRTAPAVGDSAVYVVTSGGYVKAFDRTTGRRRWITERAGYLGPVVPLGGDLVVARSDGGVERLAAADGSPGERWAPGTGEAVGSLYLGAGAGGGAVWLADRSAGVWRLGPSTGGPAALAPAWARPVSEPPFDMTLVTGTPVEHDGALLLVDRANALYRLDPATGDAVRLGPTAPEGTWFLLEPVVVGDALVLAAGGSLHAVSARDGAALWRHESDGTAMRPPAAGGGLVLWGTAAAEGPGRLVALEAATGRERWAAPLAAGFTAGGVAVHGGRAFTAAPAGALDLATGRLLWSTPEAGIGSPGVSASGDRVWVATLDSASDTGGLAAFDAADGRPLWRASLGAGAAMSPAERPWALDDVVVVPLLDGPVVGVDAATGALRWRFAPAGGRLGGVTVAGGRVVVVHLDGAVTLLDSRGRAVGRFSDVELNLEAYSGFQRPAVVGGVIVAPIGVALLAVREPSR